jgi:hypothetical protein
MTVFRRATRFAFVATLIALGSACDDDEPTGDGGSIAITLMPATVSVAQGASTFITVAVTRSGGFDGTVTLTVSNLPNGVAATVTPATVTAGTSSARIDLTATSTVATGSSFATVSASAPGVPSVSSQLTLSVTPSTYTLSIVPASLTIAAGSNRTANISIARTDYPGAVSLAVFGAPAGVQASFDPPATTTNATTMTLSVGAGVAPGSYALLVGDAATHGDDAIGFNLVVVAAPGGSSNVEYLYCDAAQAPVFLAYQDGTGAWQPVTPSVANGVTRYAFNLSSGRGGVLTVYQSSASFAARSPSMRARMRYAGQAPFRSRTSVSRRYSTVSAVGDVYSTNVLYGSTAELAADGAATCALSLPTRTVRANVLGLSAGQYAVVSLGNATNIIDGATATGPTTFEGVKEGLVDFVGSRIVTPGLPPDRVLIFRDLNPADGSVLGVPVDFNSSAASAPAVASTTVTGGNGHLLEVFNEVVTATSHVLLWADLSPSAATTRPWIGLSAARRLATDVHGLIVFASDPGSSGDFRVASRYVGPVGDQTIALGAAVDAATTSVVAGGAYPRYRFQGAIPSEYNKGLAITVFSEDGGNDILLMAARGYLEAAGNAQAYDLTMPDVAALAGFPVDARLTAGNNVVSTDAFGFSGAGVFDLLAIVGAEFRASVRVTSLVVP